MLWFQRFFELRTQPLKLSFQYRYPYKANVIEILYIIVMNSGAEWRLNDFSKV